MTYSVTSGFSSIYVERVHQLQLLPGTSIHHIVSKINLNNSYLHFLTFFFLPGPSTLCWRLKFLSLSNQYANIPFPVFQGPSFFNLSLVSCAANSLSPGYRYILCLFFLYVYHDWRNIYKQQMLAYILATV